MAKSVKAKIKSKGYDPTIARMVGNMLAGDTVSWRNLDYYAIKTAIAVARETVRQLRQDP